MKHFLALSFVLVVTVWSVRNLTALAFVESASWHKNDDFQKNVFRRDERILMSKIGRAALPKEAKKQQLPSRPKSIIGHARLAPTCQEPKQTCSSTRTSHQPDRHGSGATAEKNKNLKTVSRKVHHQGRPGADAGADTETNWKSVVGLMVGLSCLGAVPENAQAAQSLPPAVGKVFGMFSNTPPLPATRPTPQAPLLSSFLGNIGSKAAVATPYLKAKPDPSPAAPFQDRNPNAYQDTSYSNVDKEELRERLKRQQKPGKNNPYSDGDFRPAYASFWVDSNT